MRYITYAGACVVVTLGLLQIDLGRVRDHGELALDAGPLLTALVGQPIVDLAFDGLIRTEAITAKILDSSAEGRWAHVCERHDLILN